MWARPVPVMLWTTLILIRSPRIPDIEAMVTEKLLLKPFGDKVLWGSRCLLEKEILGKVGNNTIGLSEWGVYCGLSGSHKNEEKRQEIPFGYDPGA